MPKLCLDLTDLSSSPQDKTFDCPCHGSIFDRNGRCINGPAIKDLEDLGSIKLQPAAGEPAGEAIDAAAIDSAAAGGGSTIPTAGSSNQQSQQQPPGTSRQ